MKRLFTLLLIVILAAAGCAAAPQLATTDATESTTAAEQTTQISAEALPANMTLDEAANLVGGDQAILLIDVRSAEEYAGGHLPGALLLPLDQLEDKIGDIAADKNAVLIVYCRSGNRSSQAQALLKQIGYQNVCDAGGIINYGGEIEK